MSSTPRSGTSTPVAGDSPSNSRTNSPHPQRAASTFSYNNTSGNASAPKPELARSKSTPVNDRPTTATSATSAAAAPEENTNASRPAPLIPAKSTTSSAVVNIDGTFMISEVKDLAGHLRSLANDHTKLAAIKGNEELIHRLDEVLTEIELQSSKIIQAVKFNKNVLHDLAMLKDSMHSIETFFTVVAKAGFFTSKSKLKLQMQNLYQSLRARLTQVMAAVSLALLTDNKPAIAQPEPNPIRASSEIYRMGLNYFYGLNGRVLNYTFAFEKFIQAAEYSVIEGNNSSLDSTGNTATVATAGVGGVEYDAMIMTARCYLQGKGIEENADVGLAWLEKAANSGQCPPAKTEIAKLIISQIQKDRPFAIRNTLVNGDVQSIPMTSNTVDRVRQKFLHLRHNATTTGGSKTPGPTTTGSSAAADVLRTRFSVSRSRSASNAAGIAAASMPDDFSIPPLTATTLGGDGIMGYDDNGLADHAQHQNNEQDIQHAVQLLLEAATDGHVEAKTILGTIYEEAGDVEQAAKWYSLASNSGDSRGTYHLGQLFLVGGTTNNGLTITSSVLAMNRHKAFSLFSMAAKNGQVDAYNGLGLCYESGIGIDANMALALQAFRKGAQLGSIKAMYNLGYLLVKNAIEIMENMKKVKVIASHMEGQDQQLSLDMSSIQQQHHDVYQEMGTRTEKAIEEGIHWLRCAAENKEYDASFQLGRLYEQAIGLPHDSHAALANYMRAADQGAHAKAALYAANLLYAQQDIYEKNIYKSAHYYQIAAEANIPEAMNALALLLEDGRATIDGRKDLYSAATWYYEACLDHYPEAFLNLALLLATDPIYSFQARNGEIITIAQALRMLEQQLPLELLEKERMEMFHSLVDNVVMKVSSKQAQLPDADRVVPPPALHIITGKAVPNKAGGLSSFTSAAASKAPHSTAASYQGNTEYKQQENRYSYSANYAPGNGGTELDEEAASMVLVDSTVSPLVFERQRSNLDLRTVPTLNKLANQQQQMQGQRPKSMPTNKSMMNNNNNRNNNNFNQTMPLQSSAARQQQSQQQQGQYYSGEVSFNTNNNNNNNSSQSRTLNHASNEDYDRVYRSGEIFVTNGEIPPPNYVPRVQLQTAPAPANKPGHAGGKANSSNNNRAGLVPTNLPSIAEEKASMMELSRIDGGGASQNSPADVAGNTVVEEASTKPAVSGSSSAPMPTAKSLWSRLYNNSSNAASNAPKANNTLTGSSGGGGEVMRTPLRTKTINIEDEGSLSYSREVSTSIPSLK